MNCLYVLSFMLALAVHGDASSSGGTNDFCTALKDDKVRDKLFECFRDDGKCSSDDLKFKKKLFKDFSELCENCDVNAMRNYKCLMEEAQNAGKLDELKASLPPGTDLNTIWNMIRAVGL